MKFSMASRALKRSTWTLVLGVSALYSASVCATPPSSSTLIETDLGTVQGLVTNGARAFLGLPYAAPPVGDLRWKAPAPAAAWSGVRDATVPGGICRQGPIPPAGTLAPTSEDCLYLNVYTPEHLGLGKKLPVLFWIHGGAYITGAGSQYDGSVLAQKAKAVVVTINYRLGIFGMMALPALQAENPAGNYALQDQQAALRWVQRNIAAFGGDHNNVTLFGQSAGGSSVCQQVVSPLASGLFHRAIMQSGPCTLGSAPLAVAQATGAAVAANLNCPEGPEQLSCLRSKSTDEVFFAAPGSAPGGDLASIIALTPYVDGVVLPQAPLEAIQSGNFNRVPVMVGATLDEGRLFISLAYNLARGTPLTEQEYQDAVRQTAGNDTAAQLLTSVYSSASYGSPSLAFSALFGDNTFACPAQRAARAFSRYTPTYAYEFADRTVPPIIADPFMEWGAYHAAELGYLFQTDAVTLPPSPPISGRTPEQLELADSMLQYWARFAATGNPNGKGNVLWPRFVPLLAPTQVFKTGPITTDLLGGVANTHNCLLWDSFAALGLGN